jgi:hypothetical protein
VLSVPMRPVITSSSSRRGAVAGAKRVLHQHTIDPAPKFVAREPDGSDHHKAETTVKPDRGGVGAVADHGHDLPKSPCLAFREQGR